MLPAAQLLPAGRHPCPPLNNVPNCVDSGRCGKGRRHGTPNSGWWLLHLCLPPITCGGLNMSRHWSRSAGHFASGESGRGHSNLENCEQRLFNNTVCIPQKIKLLSSLASSQGLLRPPLSSSHFACLVETSIQSSLLRCSHAHV